MTSTGTSSNPGPGLWVGGRDVERGMGAVRIVGNRKGNLRSGCINIDEVKFVVDKVPDQPWRKSTVSAMLDPSRRLS
jgi:hypothetical protein